MTIMAVSNMDQSKAFYTGKPGTMQLYLSTPDIQAAYNTLRSRE